MNKSYFAVSIATGLLGGILSSYWRPIAVQAQAQAPEEIRAQRFTLVNQSGAVMGTFSFDQSGRPQIILRDASGHDVWKVVAEHPGDQHMTYGRFHSK